MRSLFFFFWFFVFCPFFGTQISKMSRRGHLPLLVAALLLLLAVVVAEGETNNAPAVSESVSVGGGKLAHSLMNRYYDGMNEQEIKKNDAYRRANPLFEQCVERADRLAGEFGVGKSCGNVALMKKCTHACRRSFEHYFRTLTTGCWVEIIVGLDHLHPDVAQHWKIFGEKIDTLCYHPPKPPVKRKHKKVEEKKVEPEEEEEEEDESPPPGDVNLRDDFEFPQRYADQLDSEFPDRFVKAPAEKSNTAADILPWRRQHLVGRIAKDLDQETKADLENEGHDAPDMQQNHIGPADAVIAYDAEREKGWLPGLDNA